jgi:phosphatidylcholine synthase
MPARARRLPPFSFPRVAAFAVHLLTASGAVLALLALIAASEERWTDMFAWLGAALLIDGLDGALARRLMVATVLPRWSGETLDLVVDYLNYVLVPAFAIALSELLPPAFALPATAAILVSSAIYFADRRMRTKDSYFRGFPALWNVAAFYLFLLQPEPFVALAVVAILVVFTFLPIPFVHPLRVKTWPATNVTLLVLWAICGGLALLYDLAPPPLVTIILVTTALYFLVAGIARPAPAIREK